MSWWNLRFIIIIIITVITHRRSGILIIFSPVSPVYFLWGFTRHQEFNQTLRSEICCPHLSKSSFLSYIYMLMKLWSIWIRMSSWAINEHSVLGCVVRGFDSTGSAHSQFNCWFEISAVLYPLTHLCVSDGRQCVIYGSHTTSLMEGVCVCVCEDIRMWPP